jgi:hypothetical protein
LMRYRTLWMTFSDFRVGGWKTDVPGLDCVIYSYLIITTMPRKNHWQSFASCTFDPPRCAVR